MYPKHNNPYKTRGTRTNMIDEFKRHIAYKLKIGDILDGKLMFDEEKFKCLELHDKKVSRVNVVANIIDKYVQDGEKKFASITLDDATGQLKMKVFGDEIEKFANFEQGDTIMAIGLLRHWNDEIYAIPEILKKKEPRYLLVRKLETDISKPEVLDKTELNELKDKIIELIKKEESNGGAEISKITEELKAQQDSINKEIKKLLEEGTVYEPRPGKVRYLG